MNFRPPDGVTELALEHWCEVCGRTETLTPQQAYDVGWDFPPRMGAWGINTSWTCSGASSASSLSQAERERE